MSHNLISHIENPVIQCREHGNIHSGSVSLCFPCVSSRYRPVFQHGNTGENQGVKTFRVPKHCDKRGNTLAKGVSNTAMTCFDIWETPMLHGVSIGCELHCTVNDHENTWRKERKRSNEHGT